ncbi:pyruvate dehydrogenase (acetyl-transferring) E1 component subunit alpha [Rhizobium sp. P32RR-XVIII]|uniref:pyruvate dehydrogenase (acetyl-transferring) E1 component subunit alpha n=1 Tax=Rhizobium sp. P32RR-XVIII TaxID=2726738 RepID=UPI002484B765|nr:pyruvate dehydrogenase (acetyl-transferring) E1 component subunit alpha [Rhizobium sp. P32RR-XVIII]
MSPRISHRSTAIPEPPDGYLEAGLPELLDYYRTMLLIRRFEERAGQLYGSGLIGGFCHLYIGQEAIAVGMRAVFQPGDQIITSYRDHGHMIAAGMSPRAVMAELTGRDAGVSRGKGGSMHMFDVAKGFYGGHGIVGAQVSLGTGLAFANRYRGNGAVCFAYMGDGAVNQGQVAESFNMAAVHSLPIVYVIENNRYAMGTSVERSTTEVPLYQRGLAFNVPGERVNGMDILAVREAGARARSRAAAGDGPTILEMETYRYRGHSMSDPAKYRTREEVDTMRSTRDPIESLRSLIERRDVERNALEEIDASVKGVVQDAAQFASSAPEPDALELTSDIYRN